MPSDVSGSPAGDREPDDGTLEQEFREALRRLGLTVDTEDFDLALAGYSRVMREVEVVRRHLSEARSGAVRPAKMVGGNACA